MVLSEIVKLMKVADCVCFDVDSTVIKEESIDELAKACGKESEIAELTKQAMGGKMPFEEAISRRLHIMKPSLEILNDFIENNPPNLTPGIKEVVDYFHANNIPVYLISGGFKSIIGPVAAKLNIPYTNIYANRLKFYHNGEFAGYEESSPTAKTGGKGFIIHDLKLTKNYKHVVLVGDGATDLEACPPADVFVGFGGNVIRENVRNKCNWYCTSFVDLAEALTK
ncbi:PREDICTED: phosphoserine phosphatase [Nicrophorus vespilloides]|uniref:Phosphoserine phosphatase n=1 Tax=Nicrophorus vespilloides TaxID=110193 RepID=A0ABM1NBZ1_NICVS|nr:PREDICTED: phosphoserine phosphatase [Nicrophorus vespilloides]